jgi:hypothetical protein
MSKTPKVNPTPNPIARDLSDVVPCAGDSVGAVEVVSEVVVEVVCVVNGRDIVDWAMFVVDKEVVVDKGRHILTAVFAI